MLEDIFTNPIFAFVVLVGLVVFFHECGHFLVGRMLGVAVEEFSIGFGPKAFGFRRGQTEYKVCWLPLGGYVRFYGAELGGDVPEHRREESILTAKLHKRALISAAGPASNFVLSFLIMFVLWGIGMPQPSARVAVMPGKAAYEAGLRSGDRITHIDGEPIRSWKDLSEAIAGRPGESLAIDVERPGVGKELKIEVTPASEQSESPFGEVIQVGRIGVTQFFPTPSLVRQDGGLEDALGVQTGDTIEAVGEKPIAYLHEFYEALAQHYSVDSPERLASVLISRGGAAEPPSLLLRRQSESVRTAADPEKLEAWARNLLESRAASRSEPSEWDHVFVSTDLLIAAPEPQVPGQELSDDQLRARESLESCGLVPGTAIVAAGPSPTAMENLPSPVELSIALAALTEGMVDNPPSAVRQAFSVITPSGALQTLDCEVPVAVSKDHLNRDRARVLFPLRFATSGLPVEQIVVRSESWLLAPLDAIEAVQEQSLMIFTGLRKLVTGSIPLANLGGPIQIARVAGSAAEGGLLIFFITVSWMSVNIGMFNLLPLPALDGGALLMQGVEGVYGKPLPLSIQYAVQRVGIILILLLFVLVFYNDILRLIGR